MEALVDKDVVNHVARSAVIAISEPIAIGHKSPQSHEQLQRWSCRCW